MAYCTYLQVIGCHKPIPATEQTNIEGFIRDVDAEIDLRLKLVGYDTPFSAPIPIVIETVSKYKTVYRELKRLYGSQVQEGFYEWVKNFDDIAEKLLELLEGGAPLDSISVPQQCESTTEDFTPIFDLGDVESWAYHPDGSDLRYGKDP